MIWTRELLERFLTDREGMFPDMWMSYPGICDAQSSSSLLQAQHVRQTYDLRMKTLQIMLRGFAALIVLISLTHIVCGPLWMPGVETTNASADSQHRFYTSLFMFFGFALAWAAQDLRARTDVVRIVCIAFLVGATARLISWMSIGAPHGLYLFLLGVEVFAPLIILGWCARLFGARLNTWI